MQDAAAVRRAALDTLDDVEPARLHERITDLLEDSELTAGRLTVRCATVAAEQRSGNPATDGDAPAEGILERAAGVQLIYEGLAQTRGLAADPPWPDGDTDRGDVDILIADILVARGFYVLARTEAADAAVETVRSFGRDETVARETDDDSLDRALEADVFELATVAGVTAVETTPSPQLREYAIELATDGETPALPENLDTRLASIISVESAGGNSGVRPSADH